MKKKSLALAVIAVMMVASLATALTLAYFTDSKTANNTFTVGNVAIDLNETDWPKNSDGTNKTVAIAPGVEIKKNPIVKNTGNNSAYVRMLVTIDDASVFNAALDKYNIELTDIFANYDQSVWAYIGSASGTGDTLVYTFNYVGPLASQASTPALFTSVTMPAEFTNADIAGLNGQFTISVVAQAIQTDTFTSAADAFSHWA